MMKASFIPFCIENLHQRCILDCSMQDFSCPSSRGRKFLVPGASKWVSHCTTGMLWQVFLQFLEALLQDFRSQACLQRWLRLRPNSFHFTSNASWSKIMGRKRHEEAPRKSLLKFKLILENRWWKHKYSTATKDLSTLPMSREGIFSHPVHHFLLRNSTPRELSIILLLAEANCTMTTFLEHTLQQSIPKSNIDYAFTDYRSFRKTPKAKQRLEELSSTSWLA